MIALANSKLNGQFACHVQGAWRLRGGGFINVVKCRMCSLIDNKEKIIGCKWDTLTKHQCCRIIVWNMPKLVVKKGGEYIAHDCVHFKNMKLY